MSHAMFEVMPCHPFSTTNRLLIESHRYESPRLWNQLPDSFRQHHQSSRFTSSYICEVIFVIIALSASITPTLFHTRLKTYFFNTSRHNRLLLLPNCLHRQLDWNGLIMLIGFFSVHFSFIFYFGFRVVD